MSEQEVPPWTLEESAFIHWLFTANPDLAARVTVGDAREIWQASWRVATERARAEVIELPPPDAPR